MVDKETRDEIIRLHRLGMLVIIEKFTDSSFIIEYDDKNYDIDTSQYFSIVEVRPVVEVITRWEFV